MIRRRTHLTHRLAPYLFIAPFVVLFAAFIAYPLVRSMVLSFYRTAGPRHQQFVGMANYRFLVADYLFWRAVLNTLLFTVGFLLVQVPASLGLALVLNSRLLRWRGVFRFAFFSPYLVGQVFVAVIFFLLLSPLRLVDRPEFAIPITIAAALWLMIGYGMLYLLAALQGIDRHLYEAAHVDGAGRWSRFWHITLPGIRPVLWFLVLVGSIASFQLFELPYVMFRGPGPSFSALTIVMYLFQHGFEIGDLGYASAIGWALVLLLVVLAWVQLRISGIFREEHA